MTLSARLIGRMAIGATFGAATSGWALTPVADVNNNPANCPIYDFPFAPNGAILLDTSLTLSPDGSVSVDGGSRSALPSIEIWSYQSGQDPFNVLFMPETYSNCRLVSGERIWFNSRVF